MPELVKNCLVHKQNTIHYDILNDIKLTFIKHKIIIYPNRTYYANINAKYITIMYPLPLTCIFIYSYIYYVLSDKHKNKFLLFQQFKQ